MAQKQARLWKVSGRVQGVGFRNFAEQKANSIGLTGWARNLDDGSVEIYAAGNKEELSLMAAALHEGPRFSDVRSIDEKTVPVDASVSRFRIVS